jgi:hypothetical protein
MYFPNNIKTQNLVYDSAVKAKKNTYNLHKMEITGKKK